MILWMKLNEINYEILSIFKNFATVDIANVVMTKFKTLDNFIDITKRYP